jgi:hypothetical protein
MVVNSVGALIALGLVVWLLRLYILQLPRSHLLMSDPKGF